jgi:ABC-type nickel/cobalt efflux system permease component RcnA
VARRWVCGALMAFGATAIPLVASAHPMGNFSISRFDGIVTTPEQVRVDRVVDMGEIPTFAERRAMDSDRDGEVSDSEAAAWAAVACAEATEPLAVMQDGDALVAEPTLSAIAFPPGQGALTLRLECAYEYPLRDSLDAEGSTFTFADRSYPERIGWREVVVAGEGTVIDRSSAPDTTVSERLLRYPTDPLVDPSDVTTATWQARAGGTAAAAAVSAPSVGGPGVALSSEGALADQVGALLGSPDLGPAGLALAAAIAVALGILHALSPGHGKTIMAAYLLGSRGTVRTAVGLGLVVAFSHTAGVLALALLTLGASNLLPVERLYPILGLVSGIIVIGLGGWLLWQRFVGWQAAPAAANGHGHPAAHEAHDHAHDDHAHGHGHGHEHDDRPHDQPQDHGYEQPDDHEHGQHRAHAAGSPDHRHDHGHDHPHEHEHPDEHGHAVEHDRPHEHGQAVEPGQAVEHGHGPFRHRHEAPAKGTGWRGLAALGLAGGMVPSVSALILVLGAVSVGRPDLGVLLTLAFGAGMALVLGGIGVLAVVGGGMLSRAGRAHLPGRLVTAVPTAAAALVMVAGLVMTAQAIVSLEVLGIV